MATQILTNKVTLDWLITENSPRRSPVTSVWDTTLTRRVWTSWTRRARWRICCERCTRRWTCSSTPWTSYRQQAYGEERSTSQTTKEGRTLFKKFLHHQKWTSIPSACAIDHKVQWSLMTARDSTRLYGILWLGWTNTHILKDSDIPVSSFINIDDNDNYSSQEFLLSVT